MNLSQRFINFVADPNIAYFLLMAGILGLYLEFSSPGLIFPGVIGAICLLLAAVVFQVLPINYTGLALIALGVILLTAEIFVTSFGILGIGGIVCFVLGSLILFDSPGETLILPRSIVLTAAATLGAAILVIGYLVIQSQRRKPALGKTALIGETGEVIERIASVGKIRVHGEIWTAKSAEPIEPGEKAVVERAEVSSFSSGARKGNKELFIFDDALRAPRLLYVLALCMDVILKRLATIELAA
jgi:membrane-bound serine protease (ClpP class)